MTADRTGWNAPAATLLVAWGVGIFMLGALPVIDPRPETTLGLAAYALMGAGVVVAALGAMAAARDTAPEPSDRAAVGALAAAVAGLYFWVFPLTSVVFMSDDPFYYFEIARNIVHLGWSTYDGIAPTNGYHLLWMGVLVSLVPVADVLGPNDPWTFLRLVQVLGLVCMAASVSLVYLHLRRGAPRSLAMLFALALAVMPTAGRAFLSGMESALLVPLLLLSNYWLTGTHRLRWLVVAVTCALAIVTRVDAGLLWTGFAGLAALWEAARDWRDGRGVRWGAPATVAVAGALGLATTFSINLAIAGTPVSYAGQIKMEWVAMHRAMFATWPLKAKLAGLVQSSVAYTALEYPAVMAAKLFPDLMARRPVFLATAVDGAVLLAVLGVAAWRGRDIARFVRRTRTGWLSVFGLALWAVYKVLMFVPTSYLNHGPDYQQRYYFAALLLVLVLAGGGVLWGWRGRTRRPGAVPAVCVALLFLLGTVPNFFLWYVRPLYTPIRETILALRDAGEPIDCLWHTNGGQLGYVLSFDGITLINGDGLVNSPAYRARVFADGMHAPYLRDVGCRYIVGAFGGPPANFFASPLPIVRDASQLELLATDRNGHETVLRLREPDPEGVDVPSRGP